MKLMAVNNRAILKHNNLEQKINKNETLKTTQCISKSIYNSGISGNLYGINIQPYKISFKGYYGDPNPAKKLFYICMGKSDVFKDDWTNDDCRLFKGAGNASDRKWVVAHPADLLKRSLGQSLQSIATLTQTKWHPEITNAVYSPNYGDNWGRHATYIEMNPRVVGTKHGNLSREGLIGMIKMLPGIPASSKSHANCLILSQLFPSAFNDGKNEHSSLYTVNLDVGISKSLTSDGLTNNSERMGDDELVKAFNDLAHIRGLKTGIRMPLSEGQLRIKGQEFNWHDANNYSQDKFIEACVWAVDLGFDSIYFDSAKHVGNYDMGNYHGVGAVPDYGQMQYITQQIRERTGRNDIAFIGEKCDNNSGYFQDMGLTAGTDWGKADDKSSVQWESRSQKSNRGYAAGPEVSNDNDTGSISYESRLNRLENCLFGFDHPADKLPCYMQMHDLFPLNHSTNTHDLMENDRNFSGFGDPVSHWNNTFDGSDAANWYRWEVNKKFAAACDT